MTNSLHVEGICQGPMFLGSGCYKLSMMGLNLSYIGLNLSRTRYVPLCGMVLHHNRDFSSVPKEADGFKSLLTPQGTQDLYKILFHPFQPHFIYLGVVLRGQD